MQETTLKVNNDETIPFTDLIRRNFRHIYNRYIPTQINIKEDDASKKLDYKSFQPVY